jgi:hypothetical protein
MRLFPHFWERSGSERRRAFLLGLGRVASIGGIGALALALVGPLAYSPAAHRALNGAARSWSVAGDQLLGFNVTEPRQNIFSLVRDVSRTVRVRDHGALLQSRWAGVLNFASRGRIGTSAEALAWFGVPLTPRQAALVELCRPLDELQAGEVVTVEADAWQKGLASWYGPGFHGRLAASGEIYNQHDLTAAHKTLPLQSLVRVVSVKSGNSIVVRINDRGPYIAGRVIDLSYRAKEALGSGDLAQVYLERLDPSLLPPYCL